MIERIEPEARTWPLFDAAASRAIEGEAAAALPPHALMQRAGLAVARLALAVAPHARRVWIAAGPGNNGGDGFEAALHLHRAGLDVRVHALESPRRPADATASLERARQAGVDITSGLPADAPVSDLAIDALLGLGAVRAPEGELAHAIALVNAAAPQRLAVDLPSGLDGDSGALLGAAAVEATDTLALLTLKPGLVTGAGRDHAGRLWFDDLGAAAADAARASALLSASPQSVQRRHRDHKGRFGDVIVLGGAPGMTGAALLAARAAALAGAGRVLVGLLDAAAPTLDPAWPELMLRDAASLARPERLAHATVACGCGGGEAVRMVLPAVLPAVLSSAARLVLDADALNAIAGDEMLRRLLASRAARSRETVLTPHPLEAARLLGHGDAARVQVDRLATTRELSTSLACTVVLKGSGSVIAAPGRLPLINPTGNARLATAGTGDVLAGWIAGHWSASGRGALTAAADAVWWHGAAAAGDGPLTASMLVAR